MKPVCFFIILYIYFSAVTAYGSPEVFRLDPEIKVDGILGEVIILNPLEESITCSGTIYGNTYFEDEPYLRVRDITLQPEESRSFYIRSRYGDPFVGVWAVILCGYTVQLEESD